MKLFMISLISHDFKTPIHLFQQNHSHHLMWKSHLGKGKFKICSSADFFGKTQTASDDKSDIAVAGKTQLFYLFCQLF